MLKPIARSDFDQAIQLLSEGFPERTPAFWAAGLARMDQHGLNAEAEVPFGFFLMEKADPVGIALTPASLRYEEHGARRRIINMSSWYVRPEHRWRAPMMLKGMVADSEAIYTDLTPTPDVQKMLPVFGFNPVNRGELIRPLAILALRSSASLRLRALAPGDRLKPPFPDLKLIEAHRAWRCEVLVIEKGEWTSLLVWRRTKVRGLPAAEILYSDDLTLLQEAEGALARRLILKGIFFLISEARDPESTRSLAFRPRGIWFAKNTNNDDRTDKLGSELCLLDL